jgi:hypothetical protein
MAESENPFLFSEFVAIQLQIREPFSSTFLSEVFSGPTFMSWEQFMWKATELGSAGISGAFTEAW